MPRISKDATEDAGILPDATSLKRCQFGTRMPLLVTLISAVLNSHESFLIGPQGGEGGRGMMRSGPGPRGIPSRHSSSAEYASSHADNFIPNYARVSEAKFPFGRYTRIRDVG